MNKVCSVSPTKNSDCPQSYCYNTFINNSISFKCVENLNESDFKSYSPYETEYNNLLTYFFENKEKYFSYEDIEYSKKDFVKFNEISNEIGEGLLFNSSIYEIQCKKQNYNKFPLYNKDLGVLFELSKTCFFENNKNINFLELYRLPFKGDFVNSMENDVDYFNINIFKSKKIDNLKFSNIDN